MVSIIQLVIADDDSDYLEHLVHYIRTTEYAERFVVKTFSQRESLEQYIQAGNEIHLLVAQSEFIRDPLSENTAQTMIYLDEQTKTQEDHVISVFKYQPLHLLFSKVLSLHLENHHETSGKHRNERQTKVVSIYSATGSCGKTTLAINLAKEASLLGSRVFYLNIEYVSTYGRFLPSKGEDSFSKILYYVKSNPSQLISRIEQLKQHDPSTKMDFFEPLSNPAEILEMTREDSKELIRSLVEMNLYDLIVIDQDTSTHEKNLATFLHSDEIIWLVTDDIFMLDKTRLLLGELKRMLGQDYKTIRNSMKFIVTKYTGQLNNPFDHFSIEIFDNLPYIPEWKSVTSPESLLSTTHYNNQVRGLYQSLMGVQESGRV